MGGGFLLQTMVYMGAAVLCVPVAKRLGLGSVLGYLIAGILIGPFVLGLIGAEGQDIMHFAEFGVVVMLFLIGLELEPAKLWRIRNMILGVGATQVLATSVVFFGAGLLLGLSWQGALAVALALSMSSTAIVLQSLKEKALLDTAGGRHSFAVLLFQDVAVIPILAVLPLLAVSAPASSGAEHAVLTDLPAILQTGVVIGAVAVVILFGRYAIVPMLRIVARTRLRELFTASALLIVVAIAYVMQLAGLSPALGTFLAGVILANSEFKHELESDLDPFKGLLLGLFFIAVGASINFHLIIDQPGTIVSLTLALVIAKAAILFVIGRSVHLSTDQNLLFALGLSQIGEFAFVLIAFIAQLGIMQGNMVDILMAVTALSMTTTPLLLILNDRFLRPMFGTREKDEREADTIDEKNKVIIAGFSHFGSTIGRFLRANGVEATILDNDSDRVDLLRKMGFRVYYGDATRSDLLESAGAEDARILIVAIDGPEIVAQLVAAARKKFPHLELMVRAKNRFDAYELIDAGVRNIYREHLDTSVRLGVDVLQKLGYRSYTATRAAQDFLKYDEAALWNLAPHRHNMQQYISNVREQIRLQEELLKTDLQHDPTVNDHAWDSDEIRETVMRGSFSRE